MTCDLYFRSSDNLWSSGSPVVDYIRGVVDLMVFGRIKTSLEVHNETIPLHLLFQREYETIIRFKYSHGKEKRIITIKLNKNTLIIISIFYEIYYRNNVINE